MVSTLVTHIPQISTWGLPETERKKERERTRQEERRKGGIYKPEWSSEGLFAEMAEPHLSLLGNYTTERPALTIIAHL